MPPGEIGEVEKTPDRGDLAKLDRLLLDWRAHIPRSAWQIVTAQVKAMPPELISEFIFKYHNVGRHWGFMPYAEMSARIMSSIFRHLEAGRLHVRGKHHVAMALSALRDGKIKRLCLVSNHISYTDASLILTAFEPLLERFGFARDFTAVVGPKVFCHPCRRFAALHFNTVQVAQSRIRATPDVTMSPSEVANAARKAINDIAQHGRIVLIFPEGGRSRSGALMRFLPGAWRLMNAGKQCGLLPLSIQGSDKVLPVGKSSLRGREVLVSAGPMRPLHDYGTGRRAVDGIARAVASLLPIADRGCYRDSL